MNAQLYCTLAELISDIKDPSGDTGNLYARIQAASKFIEQRFGNFIPIRATKTLGAEPRRDLIAPPLLSVNTITSDGVSVSDYTLYPQNRFWENGPYNRLHRDGYWSDDDVDIDGNWGLYSETRSLGFSATQLSNATTLVSSNGALLSPGMVVLIESEQELITGWGATTNAVSLLNGAIDESDEQITVDNGAEFNKGEVIRLSLEDMFVRNISSNLLAVTRGWNGTEKATHADDLPIGIYRTGSVERGVNGTVAAAHSTAGVSQYLPPADVNWLCRQIAGLMVKKAETGFSGKSGSAETGETFYFNEFPSQIKEIKRNYRITQI